MRGDRQREAVLPGASEADLAETVEAVEALDRRIVATKADVRNYAALKDALDDGVAQLGHVDIVSANAGIFHFGEPTHQVSDSDLGRCARHQPDRRVAYGQGGHSPHDRTGHRRIDIITSSVAGLKGPANVAAYVASKHGVVGLMRTLALELAPHSVRVNTVHPTAVGTDMILNDGVYRLFLPGTESPPANRPRRPSGPCTPYQWRG